MRSTSKATGYVLRRKAMPGSDSVITIFTKELGKRVFFGKGLRSAKSKRSAHLQTGNLVTVLYTDSNSLAFLKQTELISGYSLLKEQYNRIQYLYLMCFILDRLLPEAVPEDLVYAQFTRVFSYLARVDEEAFRSKVVYASISHILRLLGYEPNHTDRRLISYIEELIDEKVPQHDII